MFGRVSLAGRLRCEQRPFHRPASASWSPTHKTSSWTARGAIVNHVLSRKAPCRVATTGPISLVGVQTIDGVAVVDNDRVVAKDQAAQVENGHLPGPCWRWERAKDFNQRGTIVKGSKVFVTDGTVTARTDWYVTTSGQPWPGRESISFAQWTDAASATHIADATAAHAASAISVTPTGGISSTDAQSALAELDAEEARGDAQMRKLGVTDAEIDKIRGRQPGEAPRSGLPTLATIEKELGELAELRKSNRSKYWSPDVQAREARLYELRAALGASQPTKAVELKGDGSGISSELLAQWDKQGGADRRLAHARATASAALGELDEGDREALMRASLHRLGGAEPPHPYQTLRTGEVKRGSL